MESSKRTRRAVVTHCSKCGDELTEANATRRAGSQVWRSHCNPVPRRCPQGVVRLLNKDHDHRTGEWRGLLCTRCNQAIGMFNDNVALLQSAIEYLQNPPGLVLVDDEPAEARQEWRKGPYAPQITDQP